MKKQRAHMKKVSVNKSIQLS